MERNKLCQHYYHGCQAFGIPSVADIVRPTVSVAVGGGRLEPAADKGGSQSLPIRCFNGPSHDGCQFCPRQRTSGGGKLP